jgi:hypothetical protein
LCVLLSIFHQATTTTTNRDQAWNAELLLEMELKILLRKTGARLILKIALMFLHFDPDSASQPSVQLNLAPPSPAWPSALLYT